MKILSIYRAIIVIATSTALVACGESNESSTGSSEEYDTTPPVISILGNSVVNIEVMSSYIDKGATALDNQDGDITHKIKTVNLVDSSKTGSYTVTYNVSDSTGNLAVPATRKVNIVDSVDSLLLPPQVPKL